MASLQRSPRDILLDTDADYRRLFEEHEHYETELRRILSSPYLSSEDLLEEIKLKKIILLVSSINLSIGWKNRQNG